MSVYTKEIDDLIACPNHKGPTKMPFCTGSDANFRCGCAVTIVVEMISDQTLIERASYISNGCGYMLAAAEILCRDVSGKRLEDLGGSPEPKLRSAVISKIRDVPEARSECVSSVIRALKNTLTDLRSRRLREFTGELPLVCTCFGITEDAIQECIARENIKGLGELMEKCRAGTGCGSCQPILVEILAGPRT